MDFDNLPPNIFLEILHYLPINEQARIGRVNKRFKELSNFVVSEIKSINATDDQFRLLNGHSLSNLLQLCKSNLAEIIIKDNDAWLETFAQFTCSNLIELEIDTNHVYDFFGRIMENNRNLINIKWIDKNNNRYLHFLLINCDKLKTLKINQVNDGTFYAMTGRCPNLRSFRMEYTENSLVSSLGNIFDNFCASCPNLESLIKVNDGGIQFRYEQLKHFWNLRSVRDLALGGFDESILFKDQGMEKISTSFPLLENLLLERINLTNAGFISLSSLKNLKRLWLFSILFNAQNIDLGIRRLVKCERLQILSLRNYNITSTTMITLLQHCHELRDLKIKNVTDIETIEEAITINQTIGGFINRNISIEIVQNKEIRKSDEMKTALNALENGHMIKIN